MFTDMKRMKTIADLWSDTDMDYAEVSPGDMVFAGNQLLPFQIAEPDATDHDGETVGLVRFYIWPGLDGRYHSASWNIAEGVDETDKLRAFCEKTAGGHGVIDKGSYIHNRLTIRSNTTLDIERGTLLTVLPGGLGALYTDKTTNVTINGGGASIYADGTQLSHTINILRARNVEVTDLFIDGSGGTGDDGVYVGGSPSLGPDGICHNVNLRRLNITNPGRNGISIVAGWDVLVEDTEVSNAVLMQPKSGVGVEANVWMADGQNAAKRITLRRVKAHGCDTSGIYCTFGSEVLVDDCDIYSNKTGARFTTSGNPHDERYFKEGWLLPLIALDTATGWLTCAPVGKHLTADYGLLPGMIVTCRRRNGGEVPPELLGNGNHNFSYTIVNEISDDGRSIKLAEYFGVDTIAAFANDAVGVLTDDPLTSEIFFTANLPGHNDRIKIQNSRFWDNDVDLAGTLVSNLESDGCTFNSRRGSINIQYSNNWKFSNNEIRSTKGAASSASGILVSKSGPGKTFNNRIIGFPNHGIQIAGCTDCELVDDVVIDCGHAGNESVLLSTGTRPRVSGTRIKSSGGRQGTHGLRLYPNSVSDALIDSVNCTSAGTGNSNSLSISNNTATVLNSRVRDGTLYT